MTASFIALLAPASLVPVRRGKKGGGGGRRRRGRNEDSTQQGLTGGDSGVNQANAQSSNIAARFLLRKHFIRQIFQKPVPFFIYL